MGKEIKSETSTLILENKENNLGLERIFEYGSTGGDPKKSVSAKEVDPAKQVNDPDKDAANPDLEDLFTTHQSVLFLTGDENGIIQYGSPMQWVELSSKIVSNKDAGMDIDLEDFQWICPTEGWNSYLSKTGRQYDKNKDEWDVKENEEENLEEERTISSYSDFIEGKENSRDLNEFFGFLNPTGRTRQTRQGMEYSEKDTEFVKGALGKKDRNLLKFIFTKNKLNNSGKIEKKLDIKKLKKDEAYEIFVMPFDAQTGKTEKLGVIGVTFKVIGVIPKQGDIAKPMVIGEIQKMAPNFGKAQGTDIDTILGQIVSTFDVVLGEFEKVFSTAWGKIFTGLSTLAGLSKIMGYAATPLLAWRGLSFIRYSSMVSAYISSGKTAEEALALARGARAARSGSSWWAKAAKTSVKPVTNFVKYPATVLNRIKTAKNVKFLKGWNYAKYITFGAKYLVNARKAKSAALGAKIIARGSNAFKFTNPLGWVLLGVDAIGSAINYTSDNQAPSWDPILGSTLGGDSLKAFNIPGSTNIFVPKDIKAGENITLCWTQNPGKGFAAVLSFVVSNSTRTTMNLTKMFDFDKQGFSLFLINSVNSKEIWDDIKVYNLRLLFIKHGTYEEGIMDDNIGCKFFGVNQSSEDKDSIPPISYFGHCDYVTFYNAYSDAPDQLVVIDKTAPENFEFHFEDSESNVINVYGRKITDKDIEKADESEIYSLFHVEPVSTLIGNPDDESEEEKEERESIERSTEKESEDFQPFGDSRKKSDSIVSNESWYYDIDNSKPISSFNEFKSLKESILLEYGKPSVDAVEKEPDEKNKEGDPSTADQNKEAETQKSGGGGSIPSNFFEAKEAQKRFEDVLFTQEGPYGFAIYFVEKREYADPTLRGIYKPGSFMNFTIDGEALSASNGDSIQGSVLVNNLDVLLDVKKGIYNFSKKDKGVSKEELEKSLEDQEKKSDEKIPTSIINREGSPIYRERIKDEDTNEIKKAKERISSEDQSSLDIEDWDDVTSVKIIKGEDGNPETIKIKNRKAKLGDKSRRISKDDPNFASALRLAKAFEDKKEEETIKSQDKN
jgi:hypothetical protein